jgi:signal transduction histidine kinase
MGTSARPAEPDAKRRVELERLAEEQAALRRVATLVAGGASPDEVFAAVGDEVARTLGFPTAGMLRYEADQSVTMLATAGSEVLPTRTRLPPDAQVLSTAVLDAGGPARVDYTQASGRTAESVRAQGVHWGVGAPIIVERALWGVMCVGSTEPEPPPSETEARLVKFTELLATAIANAESRKALAQLAEEQAALRRVATLVAAGAPPQEVFEAVSVEVAALIPAEGSALTRYEADGTVTALSGWTTEGGYSYVGERYELEGTVSGLIFETGRPGRAENYAEAPGMAPEAARAMGWHSSVGAPITVEGRLWGVLAVVSKNKSPLPPDTEQRLAAFTELVATAIANTEAHQELARLAVEQAALRRVATLVAAGAPPAEVFDAVTGEVAALIPADASALTRFEAEGTFTPLSGWAIEGGQKHVGRRFERAGTVSGLIFETGRPGRLEKYAEAPGEASAVARELGWRSAVGAPITVAGRLWGALIVVSKSEQPLPPETEGRLVEFTELVATAIANSQAHQELARLADEQAALRRVATLAAQGATPGEVFKAVSAEVAPLVGGDAAAITRYEADGTFMAVGGWVSSGGFPVTGMHLPLEGSVSGLILETRCPSRIDSFEGQPGETAAVMLDLGWRSAIGAPISVEGHLWGVLVVYSKKAEPLPADTERRLGQFTQIVATAIANTESRAELEASRARIVATADATRRQIERDLHDGAQQRLVSLALQLRAAQSAAPRGAGELVRQLDGVATGLAEAIEELSEIARGLHPAILAEGGLRPALKALARRSAVPVELGVQVEGRLPQPVEIAAYYAVAEALTNVAKHARASAAEVQVEIGQDVLHVRVRDDGHGGAGFGRGSGLVGLKDRVEALGGRIRLDNPPGAGTALDIVLPLGDPSGPRRQPGTADPAREG